MSTESEPQKQPPHVWMSDAAILRVVDAYNGLSAPWHMPLTPEFVAAVMFVESKGDPLPISTSGARGLLQVKPYKLLDDRPPVREELWPLSNQLMQAANVPVDAKVTDLTTPEGQVAAGLSVFLEKSLSLHNYANSGDHLPAENMRGNLYLLALGYKAGNAGLQGDFAALKPVEDEKFNLAYPPKVAAYARFISERYADAGDVIAAQRYKDVEISLIEGATRAGITERDFMAQIQEQYEIYDDARPFRNDFAHTWSGYRFDVSALQQQVVQAPAPEPTPIPEVCDALVEEFRLTDGSGYDLTPYLNEENIERLPVSYLNENPNAGAIARGSKLEQACAEFRVQIAHGAIPVLDIGAFEDPVAPRSDVRLADNSAPSLPTRTR